MITMTTIKKKKKKEKEKKRKPGWEYLKTWVGIFPAGNFWVRIFQGEFSRGEFDWWKF